MHTASAEQAPQNYNDSVSVQNGELCQFRRSPDLSRKVLTGQEKYAHDERIFLMQGRADFEGVWAEDGMIQETEVIVSKVGGGDRRCLGTFF